MNLLMKCIESVLLQLNKKYVIDPDSLRIADEAHLIPFFMFNCRFYYRG
jgi:hypothetical protein